MEKKKIFPGWITIEEALQIVHNAGIETGKPNLFWHVSCDNIHGCKIHFGKLEFWLVFRQSLDRYIQAAKEGAVQGRRANILEDGMSWKWKELREAGLVNDPPRPVL